MFHQFLIRVNEQKGLEQYLQSRLKQTYENLVGEFNMVCNHHRDLQVLQVGATLQGDFTHLGQANSSFLIGSEYDDRREPLHSAGVRGS